MRKTGMKMASSSTGKRKKKKPRNNNDGKTVVLYWKVKIGKSNFYKIKSKQKYSKN